MIVANIPLLRPLFRWTKDKVTHYRGSLASNSRSQSVAPISQIAMERSDEHGASRFGGPRSHEELRDNTDARTSSMSEDNTVAKHRLDEVQDV
jgi:hypothetical protein